MCECNCMGVIKNKLLVSKLLTTLIYIDSLKCEYCTVKMCNNMTERNG